MQISRWWIPQFTEPIECQYSYHVMAVDVIDWQTARYLAGYWDLSNSGRLVVAEPRDDAGDVDDRLRGGVDVVSRHRHRCPATTSQHTPHLQPRSPRHTGPTVSAGCGRVLRVSFIGTKDVSCWDINKYNNRISSSVFINLNWRHLAKINNPVFRSLIKIGRDPCIWLSASLKCANKFAQFFWQKSCKLVQAF